MPFYSVQAIDKTGKETREQLEAPSEAEATRLAQGRQLTVLEVREMGVGAPQAPTQAFGFLRGRKVPQSLVMQFYEQLAFLTKAGIPIFMAMKMLAEQLRNPAFSEILKTVLFDISEGLPLSISLQKFPDTFPVLHTNLIAVGEKSGNLDAALMELVELVREQNEIREKVIKATAYPVFLLGLTVTLVLGLLMFIFPKFQDIFKAFNVKLPFLTEMLITMSVALRTNTVLIFSSLAVFGYGLFYFFTNDRMSERRDMLFLAIPVMNDVFVSMFVALFFKTLSSLVRSGIPLLEGLSMCQQTIRGEYKRKFFDKVIKTVREGEPTSKALEGSPLIPELARQLVVVGEKTGALDAMLRNAFLFYKKRYGDKLTTLTAIIQPILLFVAAGTICVVAIALFVPLFKLSSSMKQSAAGG